MKNFLILAVMFLSFTSCKKECNKGSEVTVIVDCTGSYLRSGGKDYHVCNPEKLSGFQNNELVYADYKKIKVCNGSAADDIVCMMAHENEGWIEVKSISKAKP